MSCHLDFNFHVYVAFCQNTGKTQEIWFTQVVNSLILKVKDNSIFAAKISKFLLKLDKSAKTVLSM